MSDYNDRICECHSAPSVRQQADQCPILMCFISETGQLRSVILLEERQSNGYRRCLAAR